MKDSTKGIKGKSLREVDCFTQFMRRLNTFLSLETTVTVQMQPMITHSRKVARET
jgi:hypothetical protein